MRGGTLAKEFIFTQKLERETVHVLDNRKSEFRETTFYKLFHYFAHLGARAGGRSDHASRHAKTTGGNSK